MSFYNTVVSIYQNYNGTVHFQQGIINDAADNISTSHISKLMIYHTLIIRASAVYHVSLTLLELAP